MHQLARYLQQLGAQHLPDLREAKYAEFWAHCRRHSSGVILTAMLVLESTTAAISVLADHKQSKPSHRCSRPSYYS
jgi:hypothetical protein